VQKILDVGCGNNFMFYELLKLLPNALVTGFDISQHGQAGAKEKISDNQYLLRPEHLSLG
jgi:ubiquinone/menaquinone biosynthesis C-methylase UbiE